MWPFCERVDADVLEMEGPVAAGEHMGHCGRAVPADGESPHQGRGRVRLVPRRHPLPDGWPGQEDLPVQHGGAGPAAVEHEGARQRSAAHTRRPGDPPALGSPGPGGV